MKNKIYPKDIEEIVGNNEELEEFFRFANEVMNEMSSVERTEALKGLDFLKKMGASLHDLYEDCIRLNKNMSDKHGNEWDAFMLGCADKLYPSLKRLPLDINNFNAPAYFWGTDLGVRAKKSDKFRNLIEKNAEQAKGVFFGKNKITELLGDDTLRDSLAGYLPPGSNYNRQFCMVVDENDVIPIKFSSTTHGIYLLDALDVAAWENIGKPPYVESVAQDVPHIMSSTQNYPQTTLEEWREGYFNTVRFFKISGDDQSEDVYILEPFDANSHFEMPPFMFDKNSEKLIPYEKPIKGKPQMKFANETQKQRLTELVNEAVNDCEPLRCYLENGGIIPAEEVKPEWITNTYGPNKSASKRVEMAEPFMR